MSRVNINPTIHRLWGQAACSISPLKTGAEWQREFVLEYTRLIISDVLTICEETGDAGLDGHHAADIIVGKYE